MAKNFESPRGTFSLERYDPSEHISLQAWDAADEYILRHFVGLEKAGGGLLILNDSFGALALGLYDLSPRILTDSCRSAAAIHANLHRNGRDPDSVPILTPFNDLGTPVSFAVVKIPKALSYLDYELRRLRTILRPGALVVAAGMTRIVHTSTVDLFEKLIGPTVTSRAKKKARLILSCTDAAREVSDPEDVPSIGHEAGFPVAVYPGVFPGSGVDRGTAFLLENLPEGDFHTIVDLGCGTGILGLAALKKYAGAEVVLIDESFLAVESAMRTFRENGVEERARFLWQDGLSGFVTESADLILCNPPFHDNTAVSLSSVETMFRDAARVLRTGGEFRFVANAHLGYAGLLRRYFPDTPLKLRSPAYTIYSVIKK